MKNEFSTVKVPPALKTKLLLARRIIAVLHHRLRFFQKLNRTQQPLLPFQTDGTKIALKLVVDRYNAIALLNLDPRAIARQLLVLLVQRKKVLQRPAVVYTQPLSDAAIEAHNCAEGARRLYYWGPEALRVQMENPRYAGFFTGFSYRIGWSIIN